MSKKPTKDTEKDVVTIKLTAEQQAEILKKTGKSTKELNISASDLMRKVNTNPFD